MVDVVRGFPIELLKKSPKDRLAFFKEQTLDHLLLQKVLDEILEAIIDPGDKLIVLVCGAPGVGKTTLVKALRRRLIKLALSDPDWDLGRIAVVATALAAYNNVTF